MSTEQNLTKIEHSIKTFEDMNLTATKMSEELSIFLKKDMDELNVSSHLFQTGMHRYLSRVLNAIYKNSKPIAIFPDSVPGFTLVVFKKKTEIPYVEKNKVKSKRNPVEEVKQAGAVENIMGNFFNQHKQRVLVIENEDMIFGLFPVSDTRQNLKSMNIYITF